MESACSELIIIAQNQREIGRLATASAIKATIQVRDAVTAAQAIREKFGIN
jgi:hypothetical protein